MKHDWKSTALALAVIYAISERNQTYGMFMKEGDHRFLEDVLTEMFKRDLLDIIEDPKIGSRYELTDKGRELRDKMIGLYDQSLQFSIFATFTPDLDLPQEEQDEENPAQAHMGMYDRRFAESPQNVDFRLAMITFIGEMAKGEGRTDLDVDPHLIVFMQKLCDGLVDTPEGWAKLGNETTFREIETIVRSAYKWQSFARNEQDAIAGLQQVYTAGMQERLKRLGHECSRCHTPLGAFEAQAKHLNESFDACPNPDCKAPFNASTAARSEHGATLSCPRCQTAIHSYDVRCSGCDAIVSTSLPPGTVKPITQRRRVSTTVYQPYIAWDGYYDYEPVYYDPFDPFLGFVGGVAFGLVLEDFLFD